MTDERKDAPMPTPEEVARIKRETTGKLARILADVGFQKAARLALALRDLLPDAEGMVEEGLGQRDPNSDARSETKPSEPSPALTPAPTHEADGRMWWLRWIADGWCVLPESTPPTPADVLVVPHATLDTMQEEGLGGDSRPNGDAGDKAAPNEPQTPAPTPARCECGHIYDSHEPVGECAFCPCTGYEGRTPAPTPAPAETREWYIATRPDDANCFVYTRKHTAAEGWEMIPVVPRASLDAMRARYAQSLQASNSAMEELLAERDTLRERVQHHADGMDVLQGRLEAMQGERDQWKKSSHDWSRMHSGLFGAHEKLYDLKIEADREIASLKQQLAAAKGPVSRETFYRVLEAIALEFGAMRAGQLPPNARLARAAIQALGLEIEGEGA